MSAYGHVAYAPDPMGGEGRFILNGLPPHVCIRLKDLFRRVPRAARQPFALSADPATAADLAWFMQRFPLEGDVDAVDTGRGLFEAMAARAEALGSPDYVPTPGAGWRPGKGPRAHQGAAAEMLALYDGLLVGDDVGEGKTFTVMQACMLPGALPATVVVDRQLQLQWAARFEEFTTLSTVCVNRTRPYALGPADVRIFAWTQLAGWADVLGGMGHGLVAGDEMQELRTGEASQKGVAASALFGAARYRLGVTATPIYNYGGEIWSLYSYLRPELLGDFDEFVREWCIALRPGKYAVRDPKALGSYLRDQHAFVRKRKDKDRVNRVVETVDHDQDAMDAVEALARRLALRASTGSFTQRGEASRELDLLLRQQTGVAKAAAVADVARAIVEAGEPILLVGWHRQVYDIWLERLADLRPAMHTGSESPATKVRERARFLAGDTDILIISLRSGRGVDELQRRAKFLVFGELDWSGEVHNQVIGRLDREGSVIDGDEEAMVTALFLVCEDGSDPPMMQVLGLKAGQAAGVRDPDLGVRAAAAEPDRIRLLVERYLDRSRGEAGAKMLDGAIGQGSGGARRSRPPPPRELSGVDETVLALAGFPNGTRAMTYGSLTGGRLLAAMKAQMVERQLEQDSDGGQTWRWVLTAAGQECVAARRARA